ncbi:MAG: hypothetical protein ACI9SG_002020 [Maribacter sp.]|jgi:hypothetical protein
MFYLIIIEKVLLKPIKQVFSENNIRVAYSEGIELGSIGK